MKPNTLSDKQVQTILGHIQKCKLRLGMQDWKIVLIEEIEDNDSLLAFLKYINIESKEASLQFTELGVKNGSFKKLVSHEMMHIFLAPVVERYKTIIQSQSELVEDLMSEFEEQLCSSVEDGLI